MIMCRMNMQRLWYSLYEGVKPIYATDKDGNIIYEDFPDGKKPRKTGKTVKAYSEPVMIFGDIQNAGGEAEAMSFGVSVGEYDAVLYAGKGDLPLSETSRIWYQNEPKYKTDGTVDEESADYTVKTVPVHLNQVAYLLKRLVK